MSNTASLKKEYAERIAPALKNQFHGKNLLRIDEEEFRNAWISTRSRGEDR